MWVCVQVRAFIQVSFSHIFLSIFAYVYEFINLHAMYMYFYISMSLFLFVPTYATNTSYVCIFVFRMCESEWSLHVCL